MIYDDELFPRPGDVQSGKYVLCARKVRGGSRIVQECAGHYATSAAGKSSSNRLYYFMSLSEYPPALLLMFSKVMQSMLLVARTVCFGNIKTRSQLRSVLSVFSCRFSRQIILESLINSYKSGILLPTLVIFTKQRKRLWKQFAYMKAHVFRLRILLCKWLWVSNSFGSSERVEMRMNEYMSMGGW